MTAIWKLHFCALLEITCGAFIPSSMKLKDSTHLHRGTGFLEGPKEIHRNSARSQTQSIMGYTGRGFYHWSFVQESSQVSEVAVYQFLSLFDMGPQVVVCQKTRDDTNTAGKAKKEEHLPV